MTIERGSVAAPVQPQEVVPVAALGGDVIVRGLLLSQSMAIAAQVQQDSAPREGETEEAALMRARARRVPLTLAACVVLADGAPLWTAADWDVFGAGNAVVALDLFHVAQRLNGEDVEDNAKN